MNERIDIEELSLVIKLIKEGQVSSQGKFYDLTSKAIYRFAYLLSKNEQEALDICHDTFVKALSSIHKLKDNKAALAWLFQIARRTFLDQKKKKKEEQLEEKDEELISTNGQNDWIQVRQALRLLPEDERSLLILIDMEGLSYHEAGEVLGLTEDAVRMKIFRARQCFVEIYR